MILFFVKIIPGSRTSLRSSAESPNFVFCMK
jgi:hypothetical protein